MVAYKPQGMAVFSADADADDNLVNGLLQSNRWLAEMETSHRPGVIHTLAAHDQGLVLVAKSDETAEALRTDYRQGHLTFSYRVRLSTPVKFHTGISVTVHDRRSFPDGTEVLDIDSAIGDTDRLRNEWLVDGSGAHFVLYRIVAPVDGHPLTVALGDRIPVPQIELYTAPP